MGLKDPQFDWLYGGRITVAPGFILVEEGQSILRHSSAA